MNRTPSHRVFSRTFAHISSLFTCTAWVTVLQRVSHKKCSSTHHHVSDRSLSLFALTSSSLSSASTFSLISSFPPSCSSSSMWSKPPSNITRAHTQKEAYCHVAIHNPLTKRARWQAIEDKKRFVTIALQSVKHLTTHRTRSGKRKKEHSEDKTPRILGPANKTTIAKKDLRCSCVETVRWQENGSMASMLCVINTVGKLATFKNMTVMLEKTDRICYLAERSCDAHLQGTQTRS